MVEYTRNNKPPANITLDNPNSNYTFAVFGKNGNAGIDPSPVITVSGSVAPEEPSETIPSKISSVLKNMYM